MDKKSKKKLEISITIFGEENQKIQTCSELSELIHAITKDLNGRTDRKNIIEEIAGSQMMIEKCLMIYDISEEELTEARKVEEAKLSEHVKKKYKEDIKNYNDFNEEEKMDEN